MQRKESLDLRIVQWMAYTLSSRKKRRLKNMNRVSDMWDNIKCLTGIIGISEGEEKKQIRQEKKKLKKTVASSFLNSTPLWQTTKCC